MNNVKKRFRITGEGEFAEEIPIDTGAAASADISFDGSGNATLIRWGRALKQARLPPEIQGSRLIRIAPLAFAPIHFPEDVWETFETGISLSFSIFCMTQAGKINRENEDLGGPERIWLPETISEIGRYAFWHCDRLECVDLSCGACRLGEGVFGACSQLKEVILPQNLEEIGTCYPDTVHAMPDVGCFAGCHMLKKLALPQSLKAIGAQVFNSCGLESLVVEDAGYQWSRHVYVHRTAFDHTASLQWMSRSVAGAVVWQIGLPASREKILSCDTTYSIIAKLPRLFFEMEPRQLDEIARRCFRLDFSGRMAVARLRYQDTLEQEMYSWYEQLIIEYFDRLDEFWPQSSNTTSDNEQEAFDLLCASDGFTAESLGRLMYIAGKAHVRTELLYQMQKVRNTRFSSITGFEELEL